MENELTHERLENINFTGQGGEYTKLWFVNLFLSIITLGIYSAWAKVRDTQYIYGHTNVDNHSFRYLASPIQILKGRIIAVIIFALYVGLSSINPLASVVLGLCFLVAMPWLIIQGLRFTLRMTSYRNVRFSFEGTYGGVIVHFILLPIVGFMSMYLAMPWVFQQIHQYMRNNMTYGGKHFEQNSSAAEYYSAVLHVMLYFVIACIVLGIIAAIFGALEFPPAVIAVTLGSLGFFTFCYTTATFQAIIHNHLMKTLDIPGVVSFDANMKILPLSILLLTNMLLLICTVGLAFPVVRIRTLKFISNTTQVSIKPGLEDLVNTIEDEHSAFGEEAAGLFDTDLSII